MRDVADTKMTTSGRGTMAAAMMGTAAPTEKLTAG
jgi:hypothetical protein